MASKRSKIILEYLADIKKANQELAKKERFKDLLHDLFSVDDEIRKIIKGITAGAEYSILNIPRKDKLHRGRADTLYNKIIIEFENNLKVTLKHAKEQLAGYFLGQFKAGEGYNFTLIASDFITWKVFSPDVSQLADLEKQTEDSLKLNEVESASFVLTENNTEDFFYWLDRFLFKEEKQKATLKRIEESFGYQSNVFIESFRQMSSHYSEYGETDEVMVSYEQWQKFLSIAYGSFDASISNFLIHTYLSIFSKMLAYAVLSNDDYIDDDEMKSILVGTIFHKFNIQNFVDNDFFYWVKFDKNFEALKKVFRLIAQEISAFDFHKVDEDVLKGVYQELIDLDTRHALGEYYTPDWLCERIVKEYDFKTSDKILDPACGSGSFIRAALHRTKELNPSITVNQLAENIYGIDIHPLSVQIAKTTLLLALGKDVAKAKRPVHLNIIQANTLLAPEGVQELWGGTFELSIDTFRFRLNTTIFEDVELFDDSLEVCDAIAEATLDKQPEEKSVFAKSLSRQVKGGRGGLTPQIIEDFYEIYLGLKRVKESGRDSIWKFIIQNLYKPYFLSNRFDFVIGNPPWFTYSSIKNKEYQITLRALAERYNIMPEKKANFPHLEIAAIFLSHCSSYFLRDEGKIAFVLPRSFFNADHHDNTRRGIADGFAITCLWDLEKVSPLFRIPSAVLFAKKAGRGFSKKIKATGVGGKYFSGRLPNHNCNYQVGEKSLNEVDSNWYYIKQGSSTAFSQRKITKSQGVNPYKKLFRQGATIVPRAFYFIELNQEIPDDWEDRIVNIRTSRDVEQDAKVPWKGLEFSGRMESVFLYRTAIAKSIFPFALFKPPLITLPILQAKSKDGVLIELRSDEDLRKEGFRHAPEWFQRTEQKWIKYRTEKNRDTNSFDYVNWTDKLTDQNLNREYLVLYTASAKDANATVVERQSIDLPFIVESTTYAYYTDNKEEAYYLTAILNSSIPNELMKDFQAKGLFGARHVHKKILDVYWPLFSREEENHNELVLLSMNCTEKISIYLNALDGSKKVLGTLRLKIKQQIEPELKQIDKLVKKII